MLPSAATNRGEGILDGARALVRRLDETPDRGGGEVQGGAAYTHRRRARERVVAEVIAVGQGVGLDVVLARERAGGVITFIGLDGAIGQPGKGDLVVCPDDDDVRNVRVAGPDGVHGHRNGLDYTVGGLLRAGVPTPGGIGLLHVRIGVHGDHGAVDAGR